MLECQKMFRLPLNDMYGARVLYRTHRVSGGSVELSPLEAGGGNRSQEPVVPAVLIASSFGGNPDQRRQQEPLWCCLKQRQQWQQEQRGGHPRVERGQPLAHGAPKFKVR